MLSVLSPGDGRDILAGDLPERPIDLHLLVLPRTAQDGDDRLHRRAAGLRARQLRDQHRGVLREGEDSRTQARTSLDFAAFPESLRIPSIASTRARNAGGVNLMRA